MLMLANSGYGFNENTFYGFLGPLAGPSFAATKSIRHFLNSTVNNRYLRRYLARYVPRSTCK